MKKHLHFIILLATAMLLASCGSTDTTENITSESTFTSQPEILVETSNLTTGYNVDFQDNHLYAIEFTGGQTAGLERVTTANVDFIQFGGDDFFYILPRYNDMTLEVYKNIWDLETGLYTMPMELVYYSPAAKPFIIQGNVSDIFPDITIVLTTADGITTSFSPSISLYDGSVLFNQDGLLVDEIIKNN